jgi:cyclase
MLETRIIPCLLLDGETLVKTVQFSDPVYVGDPVNVLSIFNDFEVDEILLLDIAAARSRRPSPLALLRHLAEECFIPMAYGGGLATVESMRNVLQAGFEKVVISTALATDPDAVSDACRQFGSQAVVGAVDVRGSGAGAHAHVRGGSVDTGASPVEWATRAVELGVGELIVTSIDREGTMTGFDLDLVAEVAAAVEVPVIAHGGAAKRRQLTEPVRGGGASAVAAGSLFVFQGPQRGVLVNYPTRDQIVKLLS